MNFVEHVAEPSRLLLVWQGGEGSTRSRYTVAELLRPPDSAVELHYLVDAPDFVQARAEGFFAFPAFRKVGQRYHLGVVETFMRRLPPRTRGDYAKYLEQFRLRPETQISDFALLAYTGAKLPSDGFSIIDPLDPPVQQCDAMIEVAGFRHASQIPLAEVRIGEPVRFTPEPDNQHDTNAVAVYVQEQKIGYVPRQQTNGIRMWHNSGALSALVERVNGRPERPLIYLFTRFRAATQEPFAQQGIRLQE